MARKAFPDDTDIKTTSEVVQLSRGALTVEPAQLPGQILGRLGNWDAAGSVVSVE